MRFTTSPRSDRLSPCITAADQLRQKNASASPRHAETMQNYREAHRAKSLVGIADAPHRPPRAHAQKIWLNQIRTLPIAVLHEQSAECRLKEVLAQASATQGG